MKKQMTFLKFFLSALFYSTFASANANANNPNARSVATPKQSANFFYQGQAIKPSCFAPIVADLTNTNYVKSINLTACQADTQTCSLLKPARFGGYYCNVSENDPGQGFYGYRVIGKTSHNVYVIDGYYNGGGSGTFTTLLFVQIQPGTYYTFDHSGKPTSSRIAVLQILGQVAGGDRCMGDFAPSTGLKNNVLSIKQYQGDNAVDCAKTQNFQVNVPTQ